MVWPPVSAATSAQPDGRSSPRQTLSLDWRLTAMSDRTAPTPTRSGEAPDDPGRTAQDKGQRRVHPGSDEVEEAGTRPEGTTPSRHDRTGIEHPIDTDDPGPDATGPGTV